VSTLAYGNDRAVKGRGTAKARRRRRRDAGGPRRLFRWILIRAAAIFVAVFFLVPVALLSIYRIPFVHPVSTPMLADLVTGKGYGRDWVDLDAVAPMLVYSVMMSEDARFCSHHGIDWGQLNAVIDDAMDGEVTRGASTIPMQTVKNLFLWQSRSYVRKAIEIPLAYAADFILGRRRLMEIYLNIAQWGPGIYGIEAAAERNFHRHASRLTDWEAALLAVTLPNPDMRNPARPSRGLVRLARLIRDRARRSGAYVGCVRPRAAAD
jgi:monofunctional biosynthetic peptidoglycan transglycosylase